MIFYTIKKTTMICAIRYCTASRTILLCRVFAKYIVTSSAQFVGLNHAVERQTLKFRMKIEKRDKRIVLLLDERRNTNNKLVLLESKIFRLQEENFSLKEELGAVKEIADAAIVWRDSTDLLKAEFQSSQQTIELLKSELACLHEELEAKNGLVISAEREFQMCDVIHGEHAIQLETLKRQNQDLSTLEEKFIVANSELEQAQEKLRLQEVQFEAAVCEQERLYKVELDRRESKLASMYADRLHAELSELRTLHDSERCVLFIFFITLHLCFCFWTRSKRVGIFCVTFLAHRAELERERGEVGAIVTTEQSRSRAAEGEMAKLRERVAGLREEIETLQVVAF